MAIHRRPGRPETVTPLANVAQTVYEIALTTAPSPAWRAAFLRPPRALTTATYTPELGRLGVHGVQVVFRTAPHRLRFWLRRIDTWIEYANSVVER